ncbi:pyridoxamine 5'-phosphate oxidase family protein [Bacillus songklensis]|uniref:Pyridoxamine 5'-phosphate oxidase family protein n=1 Tax=Bacillus songklensis TaxID=1069116 RepID=A0ABV8B5S9_9BACI
MSSIYHSGEMEVQRLAGVQHMAAQTGKSIRDFIPPVAGEFLQQQTMLIAGSTDPYNQVWTSILTGAPGFIIVKDQQTVEIHSSLDKADPLFKNLKTHEQIGILAIDFQTRKRMRINGKARIADDVIQVKTEQVYSNCPKYIQARTPVPLLRNKNPDLTQEATHTNILSNTQKSWIRLADTFFIATSGPDYRTDASHRGGYPGFIKVISNTSLIFPDYFGNAMFNTLGNIYSNPQTSLLFIDFNNGSTLQLIGKSTILWDEHNLAKSPGAERLIQFEIEQIIEKMNHLPFHQNFSEYSPFNPE